MGLLQLGLISWLLVGLLAGWVAARILPGKPPLGPAVAMFVGVMGALAGGLLATLLGFGGITAFDPRALITATLLTMITLTWWRLARLADLED